MRILGEVRETNPKPKLDRPGERTEALRDEVALDTFQILTPRGTSNGNGYGQAQQRNSYQNEYDQQQADDCEDLPF